MPLPPLKVIAPLSGIAEVRATIETNHGVLWTRLFVGQAPRTVANFVGLAEGTIDWRDSDGSLRSGVPFYDGRSFHRLVRGFVIQGGCVRGDGTGDIGYRFADEIHRGLSHDRKGILSMANAGRDTNDSQFFITLAACRNLDGRHAIFGEVIHGIEVVDAIGQLKADPSERPLQDVRIERVDIERVPA